MHRRISGVFLYEFIINGGCCPLCEAVAKKNGGHYYIKDMMPGENAPPMHPNCRCSTAAYEDNEDYEARLDFLDKGRTTEEWNRLKNEEKSDKIQFTEDEKRVLWEYKSSRSYMINEFLREDPEMNHFPEEEKVFVQTLDSALSKMPKYQGNLIRTVDFSDWANQQTRLEEYVKGFNPNETITVAQYWSTSKGAGYNKNANVKIYIQNAKNGRDISSVGLDEKEILYERRSQFVVIGKVFRDGSWNILLEEK